MARPTGTVTFLFTDVAGSTALIQHLGDAGYARVLADYRRLLRSALGARGGHELEAQGDGFLFAFQGARDALLAALDAQRTIAAHPWPEGVELRTRMGLHTGEPVVTATGYTGLDLHRAARICQAGWGGQTLLSESTRELAARALPPEITCRDLGVHRLKDVERAERIFQATAPDLPTDFPPLRSLNLPEGNLPRPLTSFIGREPELEAVRRLLAGHRLVSLTGPGGCGKTRLALALAAGAVEGWRDGVWLVELAPLAGPELVPQAVAGALKIREQPGRPLVETLAASLAPRQLLLVLDNCEHVVAACAGLAETLLRACPHLRILTTSRERLGTTGEAAYPVPSLSLPDVERLLPEELERFDAIRLFVERAAAVRPGFRLTAENAPLLARLCARLDGIPLAIELAAARVSAMSLHQIVQRLDDRFTLLTGGSRTAVPRQQTLQATMDWSYALLSEPEGAMLCRLSVFSGGWALEAAEAVCAGEGIARDGVLDLLSTLVDKSLVITDVQTPEAHHRLLETVRAYAGEKLAGSPSAPAVHRRHRDWYLALAEDAEAGLRGPRQATWLARLDREHGNLRAALDWSRASSEGEAGLRLAAALARFWWIRGHVAEARQWLETLLQHAADAPAGLRARALLEAGRLAWAQTDLGAARARADRSLAISRDLGDEAGIADALNMLGLAAWVQADYPTAGDHFAEGLERARGLGDRRRVGVFLNNLGLVARTLGAYDRARTLHGEGLTIYRTLGDRHGEAGALHNLGLVEAAQGRGVPARSLFGESLAIRRDLGHAQGVLYTLNQLALLALQEEDPDGAAAGAEESLAMARELGDREGIANALLTLARVALGRGRPAEAGALCGESLVIREELGDRRAVAECLEVSADVALTRGDPPTAARLLQDAQAIRDAIGAPRPRWDQAAFDRMAAAVRAAGADLPQLTTYQSS